MLPALLPLLFLALPQATIAQDPSTSTTSSCTTRFGIFPLPTSLTLQTWYQFSTTTSTLTSLTTLPASTVTSTSTATAPADVTTTLTLSVTSTSTPEALVIPTPAGFLPLMAPRATMRKRWEVEPRIVKRQTLPGYYAGFAVDRNGTTSNLKREHVWRVDCRVFVTIEEVESVEIPGETETVTLIEGGQVPATVTESVTVTETVEAPRETVWEACGENNVVNKIQLSEGRSLIFDRIIYGSAEGWPVENELVLSADSGVECCVACQSTPNCASSFFAPSVQQCHLKLTQAPAAPPALPAPSAGLPSGIAAPSGIVLPTGVPVPFPNNTLVRRQYGAPFPILNGTVPSGIALPTGTGIVPSGIALPTGTGIVPSGIAFPTGTGIVPSGIALPTGTGIVPSGIVPSGITLPTGTGIIEGPLTTGTPVQNSNGTCARGSLSTFVGAILGQEDFPEEYALAFSNGPCGRLSVWPVPVGELGVGIDEF